MRGPAVPIVSSSKNSRTVLCRWFRSFDRERMTAIFMLGGTCAPIGTVSNGKGCAVMCCVAHSHGVSALNGRRPHRHSYAITPSE